MCSFWRRKTEPRGPAACCKTGQNRIVGLRSLSCGISALFPWLLFTVPSPCPSAGGILIPLALKKRPLREIRLHSAVFFSMIRSRGLRAFQAGGRHERDRGHHPQRLSALQLPGMPYENRVASPGLVRSEISNGARMYRLPLSQHNGRQLYPSRHAERRCGINEEHPYSL